MIHNVGKMDIFKIDNLNIKAWQQRRIDLRLSYDVAMKIKEAADSLDYKKGIADSSKVLGYCYWRFSDYSLSLTHSLIALKFYRENNLKKDEADTLNSIGAVYMFQKEHAKRLECNLQCLKIREDAKDNEGVAGSQNNIGETYFEMGDMVNALKWFDECLKNQYSTEQIRAWATHNLGKVYRVQNNFNSAKKYFLTSLTISTKVGYDVLSSETNLQLSFLFLELDNHNKSEKHAKDAFAIAKKIGSKEEMKSALLQLSLIKEKIGLSKDALDFFKKYHDAHVEIFNENSIQHIKNIEFQFEIERITKEAEIQRLKTVELKAAYEEIEKQKTIVDQKHNDLTESIEYARRIQKAVLVDEEEIKKFFPDSFLWYKPKDIVSGDFYFFEKINEYLLIAVADCTGHGVPAGFLSMLGMNILTHIVTDRNITSPASVLLELDNQVLRALRIPIEFKGISEGIDIGIVTINTKTGEVYFSGALRPLYFFRKGVFTQYHANKFTIGDCYDADKKFTSEVIKLQAGDIFYLTTDGINDQFGGPLGKRFTGHRVIKLLHEVSAKPMREQKELIIQAITQWQGSGFQVDDITVLGIQQGNLKI